MIKIEFTTVKGNKLIKEFKDMDEFLEYYFNNDDLSCGFNVIKGQEIITGEIKQKGINNK